MTRWQVTRSGPRLAIVSVVGIVVAVAASWFMAATFAVIVGWAVAAAGFAGWALVSIAHMDAAQTRSHATREDPSRPLTDAILIAATVISLVDVGFVLAKASAAKGAEQDWLAGLAVISVALSWVVIHTLFTLRYALLYYIGAGGGIDFNQKEDPRYTDFAYLAFTLGMTFQVSDTDLKTHAIRATALRHALLSYLFGSVILATTINLIVSLSSGSG